MSEIQLVTKQWSCPIQTYVYKGSVGSDPIIRYLGKLRCSRGSVLAFGTQVRGFKPGRSRRIFQGEKNSFGREVKPFVPCRRFRECKRSLNVTWKSGIFRQNSSAISRPSSSSFHYYCLRWRRLAVQVGMTKYQGLYSASGGISRRDPTTIQYNWEREVSSRNS